MRVEGEFEFVVAFVAWLLAVVVSLAILVGGVSGVSSDVSFTDFVNLTASNGSLSVLTGNTTTGYSLNNASQFFSVPVIFRRTVDLFNVSVNDTGCGVAVNSTFWNVTFYFEQLVRERLVPSQQQYFQLSAEKANITAECEVEKQKLRNEVINEKVNHNSTITSFTATVTVLNNRIDDLKNDNNLNFWLLISVLIYATLLTILASRGISLTTFIDWLVNMRFFAPVKAKLKELKKNKRSGDEK